MRAKSSIGLIASLSILLPFSLVAQAHQEPVRYDAIAKTFRLDGGDVSYVLGIDRVGELETVYWGARLGSGDAPPLPTHRDYPFQIQNATQEFAGWGGGLLTEPAVKISFPDGNRDLVLHYLSHRILGEELDVTLRDIERDIFVTLRYTMDATTGILSRSAVIENRTKARVMVEQAESATWNLPPSSNYTLTYLAGRWGGEFQTQQQRVQPGTMVIESRRGMTGHQSSPWFAISRGAVTEDAGPVWFGALGWSGSWRIGVEQDIFHAVHVTGGFNPFDFGYALDPGERLETPVFIGGFSASGFGEASRLQHRFEQTVVLPQAPHPRLRPVLYNSWEATQFDVNEAGQERLAERAATLGAERFVIDDGWFGQRKDDHAGLGDWYVNPQKFPHGLTPLIDKVHALGMDFGLWVEPEMVNPDSDLYRKHPDWVINFAGRPRSESRQQLVLNLARPEVQQYVLGFLDKLVTENQIAFLKWDANRNWSEPGWPEAKPDEEKELYVKYVQGYYGILRELRRRHPKLEIEACSGGGGRIDLGVLRYVDEVWTSDNTDPFDRLSIQNGFTYAYTPGIMMAWVTDSPNWINGRSTTLEYRFLSSMQGSLGIGADITKWSDSQMETARHMVAAYKTIRGVVQQGDLYRLVSPIDSPVSATEYVAPDKERAVAFVFLHSEQMRYPVDRLFLKGLDRDRVYRLQTISGKLADGTPSTASGAYWMEHGVDSDLTGDYSAVAFELESIAAK
jgi:alpha-galactosidase